MIRFTIVLTAALTAAAQGLDPALLLKPPTDAARTRMIRASVWGDKVDVEISRVPDGARKS